MTTAGRRRLIRVRNAVFDAAPFLALILLFVMAVKLFVGVYGQ